MRENFKLLLTKPLKEYPIAYSLAKWYLNRRSIDIDLSIGLNIANYFYPLEELIYLECIANNYIQINDLSGYIFRKLDLDYVLEKLQSCKSIKTMSFYNNNMTKQQIENLMKIATLRQVTKLSLCGAYSSTIPITPITTMLKQNYKLKYLNLSNKKLGQAGAIELARGIRENTSLEIINISCNKIDNIGIREIFKSCSHQKLINSLDISDNLFDAEDEETLDNYILNYPIELHLNLTRNPITPLGALHLSHILELNAPIVSLNLNSIQMSKDGIESICNSLTNNYVLKSLDLDLHLIGEDSTKHIVKLIRKNKHLNYLSIPVSGMSSYSLMKLAVAFRFNTTITGFSFVAFPTFENESNYEIDIREQISINKDGCIQYYKKSLFTLLLIMNFAQGNSFTTLPVEIVFAIADHLIQPSLKRSIPLTHYGKYHYVDNSLCLKWMDKINNEGDYSEENTHRFYKNSGCVIA